MIAQRLKQLRLANGLSLDALAERMGGVVTKQAISKYENGHAQPATAVLHAMATALGVRASDLVSPPGGDVEFIGYSKGSGLRKKEQTHVKNLVVHVLEERVRLQETTGELQSLELPVRAFSVAELQDAEKAATNLRAHWQLGTTPIVSVVDLLEDHLVHVIEIEADEKFDGLSAVMYNHDGKLCGASVVSRKGVPGERQRLNLVHELGRIVLNIEPGIDKEKATARFAGAFLAPAEVLYREVGKKRGFVQGEELIMLKLKYGISMQVLLSRLHALEIIGLAHYRQWCFAMNKQGYQKQEPHEFEPERPQWLRRILLRALSEGLVSREEAGRMLGEEVGKAMPSNGLMERKDLLGLTPDQRRNLMIQQIQANQAPNISEKAPGTQKRTV